METFLDDMNIDGDSSFLNFLRGMETLFRHLVKCANSFLPKLP